MARSPPHRRAVLYLKVRGGPTYICEASVYPNGMSTQTNDYDPRGSDVQCPDLPTGWEWWSGDVSSDHYTRWFGTEYRMGGALAGVHGLGGYEGELYWDRGGNGKHKVAIYAITGIRGDGDPEVEDAPTVFREYDTEQAALGAVPKLIAMLGE